MNILKEIYLYLKYRKEIREFYGYALKEGWVSDETLNWKGMLHYWLKSI